MADDPMMILGASFAIAFIVAAIIIIDHNKAWPHVKKRVGMSKEIEIPETSDIKPAPNDILVKFWHPETGIFRHVKGKELPNGRVALFNEKGLPVKEVGSVKVKNWKNIALNGMEKTKEIVFEIDDESYYAHLQAEKEAHKLQIRSLQEEIIRLSKSTGDVMIEQAKTENKIAINKWKGRRMMTAPSSGGKSKSSSSSSSSYVGESGEMDE